jgi:hypothetical protein
MFPSAGSEDVRVAVLLHNILNSALYPGHFTAGTY